MSLNLGFFNEQDRAAYEMLKAKFPNNVISQSYLRSSQVLTNGAPSYSMPLINPQGGSAPLPNRLLNVTDVFMATRIGFYLEKRVTTEPGGFELQTYPNVNYFPPVSGPPAFNPQDMETIYNGNFALSINNIIIVNAFPMKRFRYVPQTQQSGVNSKSEIELAGGLVPIDPYPVFQGNQAIILQVNVPIWTGIELASATSGTEYLITTYMEGLLVAQGSSVGQG